MPSFPFQHLRELYGDAMRDIQDLKSYLDELHELLWSNGLEGSRMIPLEPVTRKGTYAEYNTHIQKNSNK